jgi:hypothetical protein
MCTLSRDDCCVGTWSRARGHVTIVASARGHVTIVASARGAPEQLRPRQEAAPAREGRLHHASRPARRRRGLHCDTAARAGRSLDGQAQSRRQAQSRLPAAVSVCRRLRVPPSPCAAVSVCRRLRVPPSPCAAVSPAAQRPVAARAAAPRSGPEASGEAAAPPSPPGSRPTPHLQRAGAAAHCRSGYARQVCCAARRCASVAAVRRAADRPALSAGTIGRRPMRAASSPHGPHTQWPAARGTPTRTCTHARRLRACRLEAGPLTAVVTDETAVLTSPVTCAA